MSQYTIRWVLTHDPIALFEEAARRFAHIIREESKGELEVFVSTPTEYGKGTRTPSAQVMRDVVEGKLEMSQTYSTVLGSLYNRLWALDLPFLFESHEHAARVLDGPIGMDLLQGLVSHGLRGLAFTYSGGYRIISSTQRALRTLDDIQGMHIRTSFNPVVKALFESLGATVYPAPLAAIPAMTQKGQIDAGESTWPRYWDMGHTSAQPVVNETSHSLFLTSLVINENFYQSLPQHLQNLLYSASLRVARMERAKSIRDGEEARAAYLEQGGQVIGMPNSEIVRFTKAANPIYDQFAPMFGEDLIGAIRREAARMAV